MLPLPCSRPSLAPCALRVRCKVLAATCSSHCPTPSRAAAAARQPAPRCEVTLRPGSGGAGRAVTGPWSAGGRRGLAAPGGTPAGACAAGGMAGGAAGGTQGSGGACSQQHAVTASRCKGPAARAGLRAAAEVQGEGTDSRPRRRSVHVGWLRAQGTGQGCGGHLQPVPRLAAPQPLPSLSLSPLTPVHPTGGAAGFLPTCHRGPHPHLSSRQGTGGRSRPRASQAPAPFQAPGGRVPSRPGPEPLAHRLAGCDSTLRRQVQRGARTAPRAPRAP